MPRLQIRADVFSNCLGSKWANGFVESLNTIGMLTLAALALSSCAEPYKVGTIIDDETNQPMANVYVETIAISRGSDLYGSRSGCTIIAEESDASGHFKLRPLPEIPQRHQSFVLFKSGYEFANFTEANAEARLRKADVASLEYLGRLGNGSARLCGEGHVENRALASKIYKLKLAELNRLYPPPAASSERVELTYVIDMLESGVDVAEKNANKAILAHDSKVGGGPTIEAFYSFVMDSAGPGARDCGTVRLRETDQHVFDCAKEAIARTEPFRLIVYRQASNSWIISGITQGSGGVLSEIVWERDIRGESNGGSSMQRVSCIRVEFESEIYANDSIRCRWPNDNARR